MKKFAIVVGALIVVYLILGFVGPKEVKVERSVKINGSQASVYELMKDLKFFQEKWSPWSKMDPNMQVEYFGEPGTVGSGYTWKGNDSVGSGKLEFNMFTQDSIIQTLTFEGMGDSKAYYQIIPKDSSMADVTWGVSFPVDFFSRPIMLFMDMDAMMGKDFENGLGLLKTEAEKKIRYNGFDITVEQWPARVFYGKKATVKFDGMKSFFDKSYAMIMGNVTKNNIPLTGAPSAIYYTWDMEKQMTDVAAVVPVAAETTVSGLDKFEIAASNNVLKIAYYGSWDGSESAHFAMDNYMKDHNMTDAVVLEEYVTDPKTVSNPSEILTNIYYIIK
jgi:effector-binding domain-containing protein